MNRLVPEPPGPPKKIDDFRERKFSRHEISFSEKIKSVQYCIKSDALHGKGRENMKRTLLRTVNPKNEPIIEVCLTSKEKNFEKSILASHTISKGQIGLMACFEVPEKRGTI